MTQPTCNNCQFGAEHTEPAEKLVCVIKLPPWIQQQHYVIVNGRKAVVTSNNGREVKRTGTCDLHRSKGVES